MANDHNQQKPENHFHYGGQAVIEGVMMRGRTHMAVAVRHPEGHIVLHDEPLQGRIYTSRWARLPFLRGLSVLWDALVLGMRTLTFSANVALAEEEEIEFSGPLAWGTIALSLAIGIGVFFFIPSLVAQWLERFVASHLLSSLLEGAFRLALFIGYVWAIGLMPDVRRVFAHHGAEHKTINAYEAGRPLTPQEIAPFTTAHARCGTSFTLLVAMVAILLFAPFHFDHWWQRLLARLLLIPVVTGIAYELVRLSANHQDNPLVRWLIAPGLLVQRLTTREPDDSMVETAITALKKVLVADGIIGEDEVTRQHGNEGNSCSSHPLPASPSQGEETVDPSDPSAPLSPQFLQNERIKEGDKDV
ncbi:MAG: DUF1385 domain-containing protein [Chloroflexi bacterium]|nr:DUF1385 domain-containing protein [Chloroflexota bacterium]